MKALIIAMILMALNGKMYTMPAQVVEVSPTAVVMETADGDQWEVYAEDVKIGDKVIMFMDNNNTETIFDDSCIYFQKTP